MRSVKTTNKKAYVLDTSILIHDPNCLNSFEENDILIPYVVLDEIDSLRKAINGRGRSAREIIRNLEELRKDKADMKNIQLEKGGLLSVIGANEDIYNKLFRNEINHDNLILEIAKQFIEENNKKYAKIALVSKDIGMRLKASAMEIIAEDYQTDKIKIKSKQGIYNGIYSLHYEIEPSIVSEIHNIGYVELPKDLSDMLTNQFIVLRSGSGSVIARRVGNKLKLVNVTKDISKVKAKNAEQHMALDVLLDPTIHLVVLIGSAGTGKTLLSLAAGLEQTISKEPLYERILCIKTILPVGGKDLGYLPGDKNEKLYAWLAPYFDNLEYLGSISGRKGRGFAEDLIDQNILELEALTYMRGRSIPKSWIILDELQNSTGLETKTALTRTGEGSKVIILADPSQIDNPYIDLESSGLLHVIDSFKGKSLFAMVELHKSERSVLAGLAAELL
jgi:PhoH-like ATPase